MIKSIVNNFTLLTAFLFFGNILWSKFASRDWIRNPLKDLMTGLVLGGLGIMLMFYNFPVEETVSVDFREFAIMISVFIGGWVSGLVTVLSIIISEFIFFRNDIANYPLWVGGLADTVALILSCLIIRRNELSLRKWLWTLGLTLLMSSAIYHLMFNNQNFITLSRFVICYSIVGMFIYIMLKYLQNSAESLRIMHEAANRDFLTGFYNSRAFEVILDQKIASSDRYQRPFSLMIMDIDYFKKVNDTYGHEAGDAVLSQFAEVLRSAFRQRDQISRWGGEEFVAIVENGDSAQARAIAERVRRTVENTVFTLKDGTRLHITVSIGCSTYPDTDRELLLEVADNRLYSAKEGGRNQVGEDRE
jgi:diguanylate cyclase